MDIRPLTDTVSVCGQIRPEDVVRIKDLGFKALICNRPDGEGADQPSFADIAGAAEAAGLPIRYIPVGGGIFPESAVAAFRAALDEMPAPVLAFCRSGARSTTMWQLAEQLREENT